MRTQTHLGRSNVAGTCPKLWQMISPTKPARVFRMSGQPWMVT